MGYEQVLRQARVALDAEIAVAKTAELASLAREAVFSSATLYQFINAVSNGDPLLAAELGQLRVLFHAAAAEVYAELSASYCREARSWA
jgi:hypothetical protein